MEVVTDDSPLATYLEGRGEAAPDVTNASDPQSSDAKTKNDFAPRGQPHSLRERLKGALPTRLNLSLEKPQQQANWRELKSTCRRMILSGLSKTEDERFLEHFRYLIIASQLLDEDSRPAFGFTHSITGRGIQTFKTASTTTAARFSVLGAATAASSSFIIAWSLHIVRNGDAVSTVATWIWTCLLMLIIPIFMVCMYIYIQRKSSERLRLDATSTLSSLLEEVHEIDRITSSALRLIQEVEVVARGYEISQPLPPISRLEERTTDRRCMKLRTKLAEALSTSINAYAYAHSSLHDIVDLHDLAQYHEIYDIAVQDYADAVAATNLNSFSCTTSLNELRHLSRAAILARRMLLCDLLALPAIGNERVGNLWVTVLRVTQNLVEYLVSARIELSQSLSEEETRQWGDGVQNISQTHSDEVNSYLYPQTPGKLHMRAQMRILDTISNGIRSLNAKMHVLRDELDASIETNEDSTTVSSLLAKQYENIGTDLRGLIQEWEQGRTTMFPPIHRTDRFSRDSSGLRSPMSPSPSLGGLTAVDEGPAEALRVLNGEDMSRKLSDMGTSDEEVFEAVSLPRKRIEMTREEKMAKMQEDRRKRATMQERADSSTSMLRELETVIKHRPRGRTTSRITTL